MRETVSLFCSNLKQNIIGLLKVNPSICGDNIEFEFDFVYCSGKSCNYEKTRVNCPISKICEFYMLH